MDMLLGQFEWFGLCYRLEVPKGQMKDINVKGGRPVSMQPSSTGEWNARIAKA